MPIAARIIEKHGGAIEYQSVPDQGTTFSIILPRVSPITEDERETEILLVEDDPNVSSGSQKVLQAQGYFVTALVRGDEGLERGLDEDFDVAITDLKLPGLDGLDLVEQLHHEKPMVPNCATREFGGHRGGAEFHATNSATQQQAASINVQPDVELSLARFNEGKPPSRCPVRFPLTPYGEEYRVLRGYCSRLRRKSMTESRPAFE